MTPPTIEELLRALPPGDGPDPEFEARLRRRLADELAGRPAALDTEEGHAGPSTEVLELVTMTDPTTETTSTTTVRRRPPARSPGLAAAALVVVALIAAAVLLRSGDGDDLAVGDRTILFDDGFDDASQGWFDDGVPGMSVETGGGRQVWRFTAPGSSGIDEPRSLRTDLGDVEVTAHVDSMSPGTTLGLWCRKVPMFDEAEAYVFRFGSGTASISVASSSGPTSLGSAQDVAVPDGPFTMSVRCEDDGTVTQLQLLVDGAVVLSATHDRPLAPGTVAISGTADPPVDGTDADAPREIVLDRLVVTGLG